MSSLNFNETLIIISIIYFIYILFRQHILFISLTIKKRELTKITLARKN